MSLYIHPNVPGFKERIENLCPTYGYCFFIDIVGSTELKDQHLSKWISFIYNTFSNIEVFCFLNSSQLKLWVMH